METSSFAYDHMYFKHVIGDTVHLYINYNSIDIIFRSKLAILNNIYYFKTCFYLFILYNILCPKNFKKQLILLQVKIIEEGINSILTRNNFILSNF